MKPIGGFLELEQSNKSEAFHEKAISLSTGRSCLRLILETINPIKIYIPYYICEVVIDTIISQNIKFEYYGLNKNLEPEKLNLKKNEYLFYINYFGIKNNVICRLISRHKKNLIIDNSQGFYEKSYSHLWSFNSARKFFGVPDGAYLYSPIEIKTQFPRNKKVIYNHLIQRLNGKQKQAFQNFKKNENLLNSKLQNMSIISESMLVNIDYEMISKKRKENFNYLNSVLKSSNFFKLPNRINSTPLCYPYLPQRSIDRSKLHNLNLFIPTYWERNRFTVENKFQFEKHLIQNLLPLPIDQRYSKSDMDIIIESLKSV
jgi:hypothetical protein